MSEDKSTFAVEEELGNWVQFLVPTRWLTLSVTLIPESGALNQACMQYEYIHADKIQKKRTKNNFKK